MVTRDGTTYARHATSRSVAAKAYRSGTNRCDEALGAARIATTKREQDESATRRGQGAELVARGVSLAPDTGKRLAAKNAWLPVTGGPPCDLAPHEIARPVSRQLTRLFAAAHRHCPRSGAPVRRFFSGEGKKKIDAWPCVDESSPRDEHVEAGGPPFIRAGYARTGNREPEFQDPFSV